MAYLQPWMLWALPAVLLPILIHLLNRLRYKTVHWAAMLFLLKANRAATRRAKIRQYILLACRALLVLFIIWAMARPLIGGWLGAAAGGAPETVLIVLDRSASMETRGGERHESKRAHALDLLSAAAKHDAGSRFVLIENVLRQPLEIGDASSLQALPAAGPTETAADIPAMFRSALDYLIRNKPGSAEVWIASDMQATNWRPESAEWQDITARFAGLSQGVRLRILDLSSAPAHDLSVAVKSASLRVRDEKTGKSQLNVNVELHSLSDTKGSFPLLITREGVKSQVDISVNSSVQRQSLKFDLPGREPGWGKVELPADDNPADNTAYFVFAESPPGRAIIVGENPEAQRFRLAAAPDRNRKDRIAEIVPASRIGGANLEGASLVIWSDPAPPEEAAAQRLQTWVDQGGVLLLTPPGTNDAAGSFGFTWNGPESADSNAPFRITSWDELEGPLARTDSGASLPLPRLEFLKRQVPSTTGVSHTYGAFADGKSFLLGRKSGAGTVFALAAQPEQEWGNLGEGIVLLPAVQRLLALGGERLAPPTMAAAGEWRPSSENEPWEPVETDRKRDIRWNAGVYRNGARLIALNRPEAEDSPEMVEQNRVSELLHGLKVQIMSGVLDLRADQLQTEIWPSMITLAMLLMCVEMALATSKALLPLRPGMKQTVPVKRQPAFAQQI